MEQINNSCEAREKEYEELGYWQKITLGEHLENWALEYKNRIAIVDEGIEFTYWGLNKKVDELASGLLNMGIKKGDNAVVQLPNSASFIITCFALLKIGCVPVLSMPAHREAELEGIFSLAEPVAYFITDNYLGFNYTEMAKGLVSRHPSVKFLITDTINSNGLKLSEISGQQVEMDGPSYKDIAFLLLSGGTTGTPKLIPRIHTHYAFNAMESAKRCQLNKDSVYLAVLPIAHNFPLSCPGILGTFSVGGKVVLSKTTSFDEAFPLIEKEKVTITALVPAIANLWLQAVEWDDSDLSSLVLVQVGGSPLDEKLALKVMTMLKCKLQQVFGMAEGLLCYTSPDDSKEAVLATQGKPLSIHDEVRIVDENGNEVPNGEFGELMVRGPYTIKGYYKAPEQNLKDFTKDGFYKSGDKVRITSDGNIQVRGRIKEQINRAGEKIMASEIESYLNSHPDIQDSSLVPVKDETFGERSCAFIISENRDLKLSHIHEFFKTLGIARYKMPDQLEFIDFWPLTSIGKVDKRKLSKIVDDKEEKQFGEYFEFALEFDADPIFTACQIIETDFYDEYLFYENKNDLSLGMGVDSMLVTSSENTILKTGNKTHTFENKDLSETIDKALSFIPYKDWRAYGTANFELSKYNYKIGYTTFENELLKLFIPKAEVRFSKKTLLLRALEKNVLERLKSLVESILNKNQEKSIKTDLDQRILMQKNTIPEISTHNSENYKKIVKAAVAEIKEPQYQKVILSRKIPLSHEIDLVASYVAGRRANTPARSFLLNLGDIKAAGFSPETVVEVDENRIVSTQPLAGTRAMGSDTVEEIELRKELLNDSKEIAEHAISIKLAFDEMLQVCDGDSIILSDFMTIAKRGTVQHIASRLRGKLKATCNPWHAFKALFPAVTATGIPKRESILAIGKYETEKRNLYSGCVMTYDSNGRMDAALVLRSFFQKSDKAWLHAGAGIVDMSEPSRELEETCEKLRSVSNQIVYI